MFRGPTKYSEYIQDVPKSIDFILKRVNAVTVSDLQAVTQAGSTTTLPINTGGITSDYFQLDTTATPTLVPGMFGWNNAYGTADLRLKGNNVTLQLGQETLARVVNKTGSDLLESEYKVVRVRIASEGGAQGQRLAVVLAQGLNDPDSATTLGIVTETIPNNQEGFITVFGNVNNINTTGSLQGETWADGDVLYLSPTIAGGLTKVKPVAPQHMVVMGYVVYAHAINGKIFVKVDNGYELDELHNVLITSPANNDLLQYNSAQQVWKNVAPSIAVPTPTLAQVTTAGNTTTNAITVGNITVNSSTNELKIFDVTGGNYTRIKDRTIAFSRNNGTSESVSIYSPDNQLWLRARSGIYIYSGVNSGETYFFAKDSSGTNRIQVKDTGAVILQESNNNVLIGTTTDAGYKLDVNGTARVQGVLTGTANINGLTVSNNNSNPVIGSDGTNVLIGSNQAYRIVFSSNRIDFKVSDGTNSVNAGSFTSSGSLYVGGNAATTAKLQVSGSVTASTALAQGVFFNNTLVAAANNDVLVGLDINPTFTNGAFTGVQNYSLRALGSLGSDGTNVYSGYVARIQNTKDYDTTNGVLLLVNQNGGNGGHFIKAVNAQAGQVRFLVDGNGNLTSIGNGTFTGDVRATKIRWNTDSDGWIGDGGLDGTFVVNTNNTERYRVTPNGNLLLNTTTDAGYKLDVNGTFRTLVNTETNPFRIEHTNGNYVTVIVGNGSALAAGQFGMYFNGNQVWSWNGSIFRLPGNSMSVANNPNTLLLLGGYGGSTVGTSVKLASNTYNQGQWTATTGTQTTVEIGSHSNEIWAPSSGNASYTLLSIAPRINTTGTYAGIIRGLYYNPTLTSITGTTHRAIETVSGDVIFGSTSGSVVVAATSVTNMLYGEVPKLYVNGGSYLNGNVQLGTSGIRVSGNNISWESTGIANNLPEWRADATGVKFGNYLSLPLRISVNGVENARFFSTGNISIGTTTDAGYKLDVNGTARVQGVLTGTANINGLTVSNNNSNPVIGSDGTNVLIGSNQLYRIVFSSNRIDFKVSDGTNPVNAGSFTSSGSLYVGGNASTTAKLQVSGSVTASTALAQGVYFNNTLVAAVNNDVLVGLDINPTFNNGAFTGITNWGIRVRGLVSAYEGLTTYNNTAANTYAPLINNTARSDSSPNYTFYGYTALGMGFTNTDIALGFFNSGLKMKLFSTGNLSIGTTTDAGYKLDVNGTGRFSGQVKFDNSNIIATGITSQVANFQIARANTNTSVEIIGGATSVKFDATSASASTQFAGKVAIGSAYFTPTEMLHVDGSIKSSALTLNGPVLATGGVLSSIAGYTGLFTVPTNPPGMQTLDIQNGIIVNVL